MKALIAASLLVVSPVIGTAQTSETIQFAPGNFGTMIEGSITGDAYADYVLGAAEAQRLFAEINVVSSDGNGVVYFNVLPPGSDGEAIFIGSIAGNVADLTLPETGDYTLRVYQMGNDSDTGKTSQFTLDVSIQ